MPVRPIVRWPDPRLAAPAAEVTDLDHGVAALAGDLVDTLRSVSGLGITGPHVGDLRRVVATDLGGGAAVFVNPRVVATGGEPVRHPEGSVSMPGVSDVVERPGEVRVAWLDLDGSTREETFTGLAAVVMQHEIDQLDGVFFLERMSRLRRERLVRRYRKTVS